ncbi:hypothetical protein ETB97_004280 [Aspergillus alliaceus]|uniref:Uncharacterized protein n=1 Tax=Petromyces alliaceus TaxID=209559 RepID=A0A8H6A0B0_PETAA|nr:hypothetical protein ETB97_004280 [Aspergillus burnettii]
MNGYFQWKHLKEFHLGPTASEKLYCVTIKVEHKKQTMTLHNGLTDKDAPLASLESDAWLRMRPVTITLSPQAADANVEPFEGVVPYKRMAPSFSIPACGDNSSVACERFEWRSSHGKEIKEIGGHSSGWKLVRLSQTAGEASDSQSHRAMGRSSDGKEIVAVIAHNASLSLSKGFRFAFLGSGLTGILGEKWEIMTVISAMHLWLLDFQTIMHIVPAA